MTTPFSLQSTATQIESQIRTNRIMPISTSWEDEIIFPFYDGLSLLNVPQTIFDLLSINRPNNTPLKNDVWGGQSLSGEIDRVVVFLTDGLGYLWLQQLIQEDPEIYDLVADLTENRGPVPLTSIAPSTTTVALPTLWTGFSAAQHGMLGTRLYLRELSMLTNILHFKPVVGKHADGVINDWGFSPEAFIPVPTLPEVLANAEIPTHLFLPKPLLYTGLSRIMHRGVTDPHPHAGYSDFWIRLEELLTQTRGQRCYINTYFSAVDTLSHAYGAHNHYLHQEIKFQLTKLRDILRSDSIRDGRTLVMILADHGHHDVPNAVYLDQDDNATPILEAMRGGTGAEGRFSYLYLRDSQKQIVKDTIDRHFSDVLTWIEPQAALEAGLFGNGIPYTETSHRIGDLIVLSRLNWQLGDPVRSFTTVSRHGGLSEWEMLIPLLWKQV